MHSSISFLLNLQCFEQQSRDCCHGNRITEAPVTDQLSAVSLAVADGMVEPTFQEGVRE